jgi:hypothetical protein
MKQTAIRADENGRVKNSIPMKIFIDTNILVYAMDDDEPVKQARCRELLASHYCKSTFGFKFATPS